MWSWPGQFVQVGEDSLWDALYEVVVQAEGVDTDEQSNGVPGDFHQVVVAQIQILQSLQEVLWGRQRQDAISDFKGSKWYNLKKQAWLCFIFKCWSIALKGKETDNK